MGLSMFVTDRDVRWHWNGKDNMIHHKGKLYTGLYKHADEYTAHVVNGEFHREDGPAVIRPTGDVEWWLKDEIYGNIDEWAKVVGIHDTDEFVMLKLEWG